MTEHDVLVGFRLRLRFTLAEELGQRVGRLVGRWGSTARPTIASSAARLIAGAWRRVLAA